MLREWLEYISTELWYNGRWPWLLAILWPVSQVYRIIIIIRRWLYKINILPVYHCQVPVIVVGNITTGGTGKTPVVIYLVELLRKHGFNPGVISRGYRLEEHCEDSSSAKEKCVEPMQVYADTDPALAGDEPVLIALRTGVPVVIGRKRKQAIEYLLAQNKQVDVVISDDGLQHYAMGREIEIAVVDGKRKFGNNKLLPAGPLREVKSRLHEVNFVLCDVSLSDTAVCDSALCGAVWAQEVNVYPIKIKVEDIYMLTDMLPYSRNQNSSNSGEEINSSGIILDIADKPEFADNADGGYAAINIEGGFSKDRYSVASYVCSSNRRNIAEFTGKTVHAVAGIGNPEKFFALLQAAGVQIVPHKFSDHHPFKSEDLFYADAYPILMTEKDAVKCRWLQTNNVMRKHGQQCGDSEVHEHRQIGVLPITVSSTTEFEHKLLMLLRQSIHAAI